MKPALASRGARSSLVTGEGPWGSEPVTLLRARLLTDDAADDVLRPNGMGSSSMASEVSLEKADLVLLSDRTA